jgi:hypothetical protein
MTGDGDDMAGTPVEPPNSRNFPSRIRGTQTKTCPAAMDFNGSAPCSSQIVQVKSTNKIGIPWHRKLHTDYPNCEVFFFHYLDAIFPIIKLSIP